MSKISIILFLCVSQLFGQKNSRQICAETKLKYSFMVAIFRDQGDSATYIGVGTLLSHYWVLTSGSLFKRPVPVYTVIAGSENIYIKSTPPSNFYVQNVTASKFFLSQAVLKQSYLQIALLKLSLPVYRNILVSFVPWATLDDYVNNENLATVCSESVVMGYGNEKHQIQHLYCVKVSIIQKRYCRPKNFFLMEAGCLRGGVRYICDKYAGAPVICKGRQYGVVHGMQCGARSQTLFTKVYLHEEFIQRVIFQGLRAISSMNYNFNFLILIIYLVLFFLLANIY